MDWIEQLFGLNLDGGNGTVEAIIVVGVALFLAAVFTGVARRARGLRGGRGFERNDN